MYQLSLACNCFNCVAVAIVFMVGVIRHHALNQKAQVLSVLSFQFVDRYSYSRQRANFVKICIHTYTISVNVIVRLIIRIKMEL